MKVNLTRNQILAAMPKVAEGLGKYLCLQAVEASFASKLVATVDPHQPIIDSVVLANVGARLPHSKMPNRVQVIGTMHKQLAACYGTYLKSQDGRFLVKNFKSYYPKARISEVKMLDLVIWQTRKAKPATSPKVRLPKNRLYKNLLEEGGSKKPK